MRVLYNDKKIKTLGGVYKMRFQKAIKRMIALGTGAIMLSSVAHAAVDLANYPMPFVKDGKFSGVLIVGDKAAAEDVIGISDIISSLQFAATKAASTGGSGSNVAVSGDAYKIGGSKKLALTEDLLSSATAAMTIRNASVSLLGGTGGELQALASGTVTNSKGSSPYNQYLTLLGPGTGGASGFVKYTENSNSKTADFLYFKSGTEIGKYVLEFTTALQSDVDDSAGSASSTGLFLTDFQNTDLTMFGKKYSIVTAKRTSTTGSNVQLVLMGGAAKDTLVEKATKTYTVNGKDYEVTLAYVDSTSAQLTVNGQTSRKMNKGDTDKLADGTNVGISEILFQNFAGGIHSATFFLGAQKLELKDTVINDTSSSNNIKVDDLSITNAPVIIEGTDDSSTFKINRITVNMTADDNFYVPAGSMLSAVPELRKPDVLFTRNWDIQYQGLKQVPTSSIKLSTSSDNEYMLEFTDGDGNAAKLPIARAPSGAQLQMGDSSNRAFINIENNTISKDDYFVVTDGTQRRGERKTYALQYKGADKITADSPVLRFRNVGNGNTIELSYSNATPLAILKLGGASFNVYSSSPDSRDGTLQNSLSSSDFNILMDMDASGGINAGAASLNQTVNITTKGGAEIGIINITNPSTGNEVILNVKTPDSNRDGNAIDAVDQVLSTDFVVNITAASSKVAHSTISGFTSGQSGTGLNLRTPSGESNIAYGYTAYGAFITRNTPSSNPATFSIDYPSSQREALVYIVGKGATVTASSNAAATGGAVTIQRIQVGAAKLASEVSDVMAQNSILVGGPCANAAAATVLGNPQPCTTGFVPGEGRVELYANANGNVAMLVAGYSALDTRNAAQVVANYGDYKGQLKGMKVVVKKVSNQLTVAAPAAAVPATP